MTERTSALKHKVISKLCSNEDIIKLIDNQDNSIGVPEDLIGINIFPYRKADYTAQDSGTYIGVSINYPSISQNKIYKTTYLSFLIVSNNNHLNIEGETGNSCCRTDLLAEKILEEFNRSDILGFSAELFSDKEEPFDEQFYCREIILKSVLPLNISDGVKANG